MLDRVRQTIAQHALFSPGETTVVGVSGGPDSLALLHVLRDQSRDLQISLHVAHLNHQLRGAESDADAEFVEEIARGWGLPFTIQARDVQALAREHHRSIEEAARVARYGFLADVARQIGTRTIAVAHNADDQVETVLMHFLRGAGLAGLRGMEYELGFQISDRPTSFARYPADPKRDLGFSPLSRPRRSPRAQTLDSKSETLAPHASAGVANLKSEIRLVRPLLDVTRAEVDEYCKAHGLTPRQDRSNLDTTFFRNRLRLQVLPYLQELNPNLRQVLLHMSRVLADDYDFLQAQVREAYARVAQAQEGAVAFDRPAWRALHPSLQRGTVRAAVQELKSNLRDVDWTHVEDARQIALEKGAGAQATLPGGMVLEVGYDDFVIRDVARPTPLPDLPLLNVERLALHLGENPLPQSAWVVEMEISEQVQPTDRWTACLDASVGAALALRRRRPGDRFQPTGLGGKFKSVHEYMIDEKIPRTVRSTLPLLVADDRILWVCGWRVDERARPAPETRQCLRVSLRKKEQL